MTTRPIIPIEAKILAQLATGVAQRKDGIIAATGISKTSTATVSAFDSLQVLQLIDTTTRQPGTRHKLICITMAGQRALADFNAAQQKPQPTPPRRFMTSVREKSSKWPSNGGSKRGDHILPGYLSRRWPESSTA